MSDKLQKYLFEIGKIFLFLIIISNLVSYYKSLDLNKEGLPLSEVVLLDNLPYPLPNNKPILIHFWATWCPICELEASNIESLSKKFEVVTIAVGSGDDETLKEYLTKHHLSFKVVNDFDGKIANQFNVKVYPTTFIYDTNQSLQFSEVGYTSSFGLYLRMIWANLL